jgi:hypothetical protein
MDDGEKIFAMIFACFLVVAPPAELRRVKGQETSAIFCDSLCNIAVS